MLFHLISYMAKQKPCSGKQHTCNDTVPEGGCWTLLASQFECCEYLHQSDYWEQVDCSHSEKPDGHSDHYHQGTKVTQAVVNAVPQMEVVPRDFEKLDEMQRSSRLGYQLNGGGRWSPSN